MLKKSIFLCLFTATCLQAEETTAKLFLPKMPEPSLGADSTEKRGIPKGKVTLFDFSDSKPETPWKTDSRSFEYDTLSADYATFLIDEILPLVGKDFNLTKDPELPAICGTSSGGNEAGDRCGKVRHLTAPYRSEASR